MLTEVSEVDNEVASVYSGEVVGPSVEPVTYPVLVTLEKASEDVGSKETEGAVAEAVSEELFDSDAGVESDTIVDTEDEVTSMRVSDDVVDWRIVLVSEGMIDSDDEVSPDVAAVDVASEEVKDLKVEVVMSEDEDTSAVTLDSDAVLDTEDVIVPAEVVESDVVGT